MGASSAWTFTSQSSATRSIASCWIGRAMNTFGLMVHLRILEKPHFRHICQRFSNSQILGRVRAPVRRAAEFKLKFPGVSLGDLSCRRLFMVALLSFPIAY